MEKEKGKYFYCAILCNEEKSFGKIGMNNSEVYTIPYRGIVAVVSDSPMKDYELTEDNTKRHEKVIRQVMEEHAVVPAEFGTIIKNEIILKRLLKKAYDPLRECLKIVDNMVELGVKAVITENTVFTDVQKRKDCVSDIVNSLKAAAKQAVIGDLFSDRLILNASFLVNRELVDAFSDEVSRMQNKYPSLRFLYSGPWAPHNFVYVKIGAEGVEITKK
jgi:16S rRNA U1498 N3-methylase RsmE